jgi:hypothetical protein
MKIAVFSYHHYSYDRSGGIIELSDELQRQGHQVYFYMCAYPVLRNWLKNDSRLDIHWIKYLFRLRTAPNGIRFGTIAVLGLFFIGNRSDLFLKYVSTILVNKIWLKRYLRGTETVIWESSYGVCMEPKISSILPNTKVYYRPSDPLPYWIKNDYILRIEKKICSNARKILVKNLEDKKFYSNHYNTSCHLAPNYISNHDRKILQSGITKDDKLVLYIGVMDIDWNIIEDIARISRDYQFKVITPIVPKTYAKAIIERNANIQYVPGVKRAEVAFEIAKASILLVPYLKGKHNERKWGLSAKYLMAMLAGCKIYAVNEDESLSKYGITVCNDISEVVKIWKWLLNDTNVVYDNEFLRKDWSSNAKLIE